MNIELTWLAALSTISILVGYEVVLAAALRRSPGRLKPILMRRRVGRPGGVLMIRGALQAMLLSALAWGVAAQPADPQRQTEVASRGADVMPFSLKATTHVFTKTAEGGTQRVIAKNPTDAQQVKLVREHLHRIQAEFLKGDFSGPSHIHGTEMPGLAALKAAKPGEVAIAYKPVVGGAELTYRTNDPRLVTALHQWFEAQLSDHGADAMAGHHHGQRSTPGTP